jgi:hypothetical protein
MDMHVKLKSLPKVNLNLVRYEGSKNDNSKKNNLKTKYLNTDSLHRLTFHQEENQNHKDYTKVIESTEIFKMKVNRQLKHFEEQKQLFDQKYLDGYKKLEEKEKLRKYNEEKLKSSIGFPGFENCDGFGERKNERVFLGGEKAMTEKPIVLKELYETINVVEDRRTLLSPARAIKNTRTIQPYLTQEPGMKVYNNTKFKEKMKHE